MQPPVRRGEQGGGERAGAGAGRGRTRPDGRPRARSRCRGRGGRPAAPGRPGGHPSRRRSTGSATRPCGRRPPRRGGSCRRRGSGARPAGGPGGRRCARRRGPSRASATSAGAVGALVQHGSGRSWPAWRAASTSRWAHAGSSGSSGRARPSASQADDRVRYPWLFGGTVQASTPQSGEAERRHPVGLGPGQVGRLVLAAPEAEEAVAELALVPGRPPAGPDGPQRRGQPGPAEQVARAHRRHRSGSPRRRPGRSRRARRRRGSGRPGSRARRSRRPARGRRPGGAARSARAGPPTRRRSRGRARCGCRPGGAARSGPSARARSGSAPLPARPEALSTAGGPVPGVDQGEQVAAHAAQVLAGDGQDGAGGDGRRRPPSRRPAGWPRRRRWPGGRSSTPSPSAAYRVANGASGSSATAGTYKYAPGG